MLLKKQEIKNISAKNKPFKNLLPFLKLYRKQIGWLLLGLALTIIGSLASILLLTLSGWFLAASAIAGLLGFSTFNYLLPAAFVRGTAITRTASRYFERVVTHEATFRLLANFRIYLFNKIFPLYPQNMAQYQRADLLNRLVSDVDTLDQLYLRILSPFISAIITTVILVIALSWFNINLALLLGAIIVLIIIVFPPIFYTWGKRPSYQRIQLKSDYRSEINRCIQGQKVLVLYNEWDEAITNAAKLDALRLASERKQIGQTSVATAGITVISGIALCLMLYFSGDWVIENAPTIINSLSLPDILTTNESEKAMFASYSQSDVVFSAFAALFVFATLAAFEMLIPIIHAFNHLGLVTASAERLNNLTEQKPTIEFTSSVNEFAFSTQADTPVIEFKSIFFRYPKQFDPVLEDLTLQISPQQTIAILGATGAGKSTLFQLLTRAYDPISGEILLFGRSLFDYSEAQLRAMFSVVPQKTMLFSATLRENLCLAVSPFSSEIDDGYLCSVLDKVGLGHLIEGDSASSVSSTTSSSTTNRLDSWMGDGGRQLSGGELRRIGIARAIIHNGPIWLFDEPTEGLDAETEAEILSLIFAFSIEKTVLMITHRLNSLERFDKCYQLKNKQLLESKSFALK